MCACSFHDIGMILCFDNRRAVRGKRAKNCTAHVLRDGLKCEDGAWPEWTSKLLAKALSPLLCCCSAMTLGSHRLVPRVLGRPVDGLLPEAICMQTNVQAMGAQTIHACVKLSATEHPVRKLAASAHLEVPADFDAAVDLAHLLVPPHLAEIAKVEVGPDGPAIDNLGAVHALERRGEVRQRVAGLVQ